jgi:hypothetical protein
MIGDIIRAAGQPGAEWLEVKPYPVILNQADYPDLFASLGHYPAFQFRKIWSYPASNFTSMVYGNGVFVIYDSTLNAFWVGASIDDNFGYLAPISSSTLANLFFVEDLFFATLSDGTTFCSSDGFIWTQTNTTGLLLSATKMNGVYVAAIGLGVYHSADGATWTLAIDGSSLGQIFNVTNDGINFIAVVSNGNTNFAVYYSPNGTTWTQATLDSSCQEIYNLDDYGTVWPIYIYGKLRLCRAPWVLISNDHGATWTLEASTSDYNGDTPARTLPDGNILWPQYRALVLLNNGALNPIFMRDSNSGGDGDTSLMLGTFIFIRMAGGMLVTEDAVKYQFLSDYDYGLTVVTTCANQDGIYFINGDSVHFAPLYDRTTQFALPSMQHDQNVTPYANFESPSTRWWIRAVANVPEQSLGGALQPLLPIRSTAVIEAPQGDAYQIPWAIGSAAAKTNAKYFFIAGTINREITIADPATVAGMIVLTPTETATIASHPARVLRMDADGVSNPLTVWQGKLNIVSNVG